MVGGKGKVNCFSEPSSGTDSNEPLFGSMALTVTEIFMDWEIYLSIDEPRVSNL